MPSKWDFHDKHGETNPGCACSAHWRHYEYDGQLVVPNGLAICSVTQALSVLDKSRPLMAYASKTTSAGALRLATEKWWRCINFKGKCKLALVPLKDDGACVECGQSMRAYRLPDAGWKFQRDIRGAGLDHESKTDDAAKRGTYTHKINEDWVAHRKVPNPADAPEAWRGWVTAMAKYIMDSERAGETPESSEGIVGSATYGYAGTCDTVAIARGRDGKRTRRDFKTSKQAYARSHHRQLMAYEIAAVEMGDEPTDEQEVVILLENGDYYFDKSTAEPKDFLNVLQVWRDDQPFVKLEDAQYKARVAREKELKDQAKRRAA